jgi:hypothetical protein
LHGRNIGDRIVAAAIDDDDVRLPTRQVAGQPLSERPGRLPDPAVSSPILVG